MTATKLRIILLSAIILGITAIGAAIYFAGDMLGDETVTTTHKKIDAELSRQDIEKLQNLQTLLKNNASSVDRASQIVSESKEYEYQDQIIRDINAYASSSGVKVISYDFGSSTSTTSTAADSSIPKINGLKSLTVTVTLDTPMPYDNFLYFLKAIEQNLTKMQVSGVAITPDAEKIGYIANPTVTLIVYVR